MRGRAVRILRQCVEGTAVMKVSCHRVEWLRSPSPACHGTETLREGVAVWHGHVQPLRDGPPRRARCRPPAARPWQRFHFQRWFPWWGLHAAADWSMLDPIGAPALWPC